MISNHADLIAADKQDLLWAKTTSVSTAGAALWHSSYQLAGDPGAGAAAGSVNGAVPTKATVGFLPFVTPTTGLELTWIGNEGLATVGQSFRFVDVCWHDSALVCNSIVAQAIVTPALTRYTTGAGLEIWGECFSAWSATAATFTVSYTNTAGTAGRSATYSWPATLPVVGQAFRFPLQAGDSGVLSIQSFTCSVAHAAAGNLGLRIVRPLKTFTVGSSVPSDFARDIVSMGNIPIYDDAAIMAFMFGGTTTGITRTFPQLGAR